MEKNIPEFENYLNTLLVELKLERNTKDEIYLEIKESLYDSYNHHLIMGCGLKDGIVRTINAFEDPKKLAAMFNKAYKENFAVTIKKCITKKLLPKLYTAKVAMLTAVLALIAFTGTFSYAFSGTTLIPKSVPHQIKDFYADYNFINSFSTPSERLSISNNTEAYKNNRSERLNKIYKLMHVIEHQTTLSNSISPAEYIFVNQYTRKNNEIEVRISSVPTGMAKNSILVSRYNESLKTITSFHKGQAVLSRNGTEVVQHWKKIGGKWLMVKSSAK